MYHLLNRFRRPIVICTHLSLIVLSFFLSFASRFELSFVNTQPEYLTLLFATLPILIVIRMFSYWYFDLYKGLWKYVSIKDLKNIVNASFLGTILFAIYVYVVVRESWFPRSVLLIDFAYNILLFGGIRLVVRLYREHSTKSYGGETPIIKKALIVGAGDAGEMILREMMKNPRLGYDPIGFVDDDRHKHSNTIHGLTVFGNTRLIPQLVEEHDVHDVVIAIPSATGKAIRRIVNVCKRADVRFKTLPYVSDLIDGNVSISQIRDVAIEDLLGRQAVDLDMALIGKELYGKVILITGAAGSIGSELARQVAKFSPEKIVLFERGENDLFHLEVELKKRDWDTVFVPYIGDVRDIDSVSNCMKRYQPEYVFHAAAYKHVPMMEVNATEAVKNNIMGTQILADMSIVHGVEKFVLISTDKAVRPTNVMGTTKRVAELILQVKNSMPDHNTHFVAVRFGNVLGSNGSVIPHFKEQIEEGGPVTVTHPEITRYFMTIPEAAQLVIQAGAMGNGGELFLLEMGEPIKVKNLAENLIRLSGLVPGKDIEVVFTGLRPGEKLYEELLTEGEGIKETHHDKIKVLEGTKIDAELIESSIDQLKQISKTGSDSEIKVILKRLVPEYEQRNEEIKAISIEDKYVNTDNTVTIH